MALVFAGVDQKEESIGDLLEYSPAKAAVLRGLADATELPSEDGGPKIPRVQRFLHTDTNIGRDQARKLALT